jgi:hypothetical protein
MTYMFQNLPMRVQFIVSFSLYRYCFGHEVSACKSLQMSTPDLVLSDSLANKTKSAFQSKFLLLGLLQLLAYGCCQNSSFFFNSFGKGTW